MKKENNTKRKRKQCGDCFYNGNCTTPLSHCVYQNKKEE